jgi:hypothetical protein
MCEFLESSPFDEEIEAIAPAQPERERLLVYIVGSRAGVVETIHNLHRRGFAEVNDWSPILPTPISGEMMSILRRERAIERSD